MDRICQRQPVVSMTGFLGGSLTYINTIISYSGFLALKLETKRPCIFCRNPWKDKSKPERHVVYVYHSSLGLSSCFRPVVGEFAAFHHCLTEFMLLDLSRVLSSTQKAFQSDSNFVLDLSFLLLPFALKLSVTSNVSRPSQ